MNTPLIGHNGGPSVVTSEKIEELVSATFDAVLKRVKSDDCTGVDLNAATKVLKEVGALQAIANEHEEKAQELRRFRVSADMLDDLPGSEDNLPSNRPSR